VQGRIRDLEDSNDRYRELINQQSMSMATMRDKADFVPILEKKLAMFTENLENQRQTIENLKEEKKLVNKKFKQENSDLETELLKNNELLAKVNNDFL
jgi:recombinational DNA repair ATPase RecF